MRLVFLLRVVLRIRGFLKTVLFEKLWYLMIFDLWFLRYCFLGTETRCDISDPATIKEPSQII